VILTKDNLAKRSWKGSLECVFFVIRRKLLIICFFECRVARSVWGILQVATGIAQLENVGCFLFGPWLHSFNKVRKSLFLLEAAVLCWPLCLL
jgi:hypothetical protein